jgi:aminoglycoside phosphotransferase (APT) family kinase protein
LTNISALPQPAVDLLAAAFPAEPLAELATTCGGFSHQSAIVTLGARRAVVKAARSEPKRADLRREARVLGLLGETGLPAAPILALVEDDIWTVEAIGFVEGVPGLRMLSDMPQDLPSVYSALGRLLAVVHQTPLAAPSHELLLSNRADAVLRSLPSLGLDAALHAELSSALAHPAWRPAAPALVHGDAGLHNILWDGRIAALLDWEWSGWGEPLLDIAWVYWTIRWRKLPDALWQAFLGGYARGCAPRPQANDPGRTLPGGEQAPIVHRASSIVGPSTPPDTSTLRALALGQIDGILTRVQGDTGAWDEWLRRAYWTLGLD